MLLRKIKNKLVYEKEKWTRRYLQGTAVSFQVVIGLWKLKETAALKIKAAA